MVIGAGQARAGRVAARNVRHWLADHDQMKQTA